MEPLRSALVTNQQTAIHHNHTTTSVPNGSHDHTINDASATTGSSQSGSKLTVDTSATHPASSPQLVSNTSTTTSHDGHINITITTASASPSTPIRGSRSSSPHHLSTRTGSGTSGHGSDDDDEDDTNDASNSHEIRHALTPLSPMSPFYKYPKSRRAQVFARSVSYDEGWTPVVHPKSVEEEKAIREVLIQNILFQHLDIDGMNVLVRALLKVHYPAGSVIIKQGDEGDLFFCVDSGTVEIYKVEDVTRKRASYIRPFDFVSPSNASRKGTPAPGFAPNALPSSQVGIASPLPSRSSGTHSVIPLPASPAPPALAASSSSSSSSSSDVKAPSYGTLVQTLSVGGTFGELSLLYNAPRQATAIAIDDVHVWALDRNTFNRILRTIFAKLQDGF